MFPGQGSQRPGMRETVGRYAPDLLSEACESVDADLFERLDESTRFLQPALYCTSLASWRQLISTSGEHDFDAFVGHSLGEFAALVAAGALDAQEGLRLVALRGRLMERAAEEGPPGGMLAVLGRNRAELDRLADELGVTVANDNSPQQVVLSGPREALDAVADRVANLRMRCRPLPVNGAFHSPAMADVVDEFRAALEAAPWRTPRLPVWSSSTAQPFGGDTPGLLATALVRPVRWRQLVERLTAEGFARFVEIGPGNVLAGLVGRTVPGVDASTVNDALTHA